MVFDVNHPVDQEQIVDPADSLRRIDLSGMNYITLLAPLAREGKVVLEPEWRNAMLAQARARDQLWLLDDSQKRLINPHSYPVGLERSLFKRRRDLAAKQRGLDD